MSSEKNVVSFQSGIYLFPEFAPEAKAAFSGREFEASKDLALFLGCLGVKPERSCTLNQVHGDQIVVVSEPVKEIEGDGLVTKEPNLALVVRTADCAPVFFYDSRCGAVGICHAGWRGAKKGIIFRMIDSLKREFDSDPSFLRAGIGPAICDHCYEVGEEFEEYFPGWVKHESEGFFFDLVGTIRKQLTLAGVEEESISDSNLCTACSMNRFFSARREGESTGRFLSAILLK